VVEGLEQAPEAFIGMLKGRNFGKILVKVWFGTGVRALPA
jgi:NADPH-dependent curcumin reductase CurA